MKSRSHFRRLLCLALVCCLSLTGCTLTGAERKPVSQQFDEYTETLFKEEIAANTINLHYTIAYPENYGITDYTVSLGQFSLDAMEQAYPELKKMKETLLGFDVSQLTDAQRLTYDIMMDYVETELSAEGLTLYSELLSPTIGYQAQLPVLLAEYTFRTQQDIEDYLTLLSQIDELFADIIVFEQAKAQAGLFMADFTVDDIVAQCSQFIEDPDNNYMIDVFNDKIDAFEGLTQEQRDDYIQRNRTLIATEVVSAYQALIDGLTALKGSGTNELGLCYYEDGAKYYEYLVRTSTGSDASVPELQDRTATFIHSCLRNISSAVTANPSLLNRLYTTSFPLTEPDAILQDLIGKVSEDFPQPPSVNYTIKYVHPSMQEHMSPAFYLLPPIDDTQNNVIYINEKYVDDSIYPTMAHEGYPGHLYQTVYTSSCDLPLIRNLFSFSGYTEGWATYVEFYSYGISGMDRQVADLQSKNQAATLGLYAYIDMGVHYDGWGIADVANYLSSFGIEDQEVAEEIFKAMVAEPANYLSYFIGYLEFLRLRDLAQDTLEEDFVLKNFHQFLLETGPAPFYVIEDHMTHWMENQAGASSQTQAPAA